MSSPTVPTSIWLALRNRFNSLVLDPALTVSLPGKDFTPPKAQGKALPYLRVDFLPNQNERPWIASEEPAWRRGILQVTLNYPVHLNNELGVALDIAGTVAEHFPQDLAMPYGSVVCYVERTPDVGQPFKSADNAAYWQVPVSIRYWCEA